MTKRIFNTDLTSPGAITASTFTDGIASINSGTVEALTLNVTNANRDLVLSDGNIVGARQIAADSSTHTQVIGGISIDEPSAASPSQYTVTVDSFNNYGNTGVTDSEARVLVKARGRDGNADHSTIIEVSSDDGVVITSTKEVDIDCETSIAGTLNLSSGLITGDSSNQLTLFPTSTTSTDPVGFLVKKPADGSAFITVAEYTSFPNFTTLGGRLAYEGDTSEDLGTSDNTVALQAIEGTTAINVLSYNTDGSAVTLASAGHLTLEPKVNSNLVLLNIPEETSNPDTNTKFLTINGFGQVQRTVVTQFTGTHSYRSKDNQQLNVGDAVTLDPETLTLEPSNSATQSNCVGIVVGQISPFNEEPIVDSLGNSYEHNSGTLVYRVASVGDSRHRGCQGFNVCNENGAIQPGDLLVTSSTSGYLMKQSDDVIRTSTVGKVMEQVTFDENGQATGVYGFLYCG